MSGPSTSAWYDEHYASTRRQALSPWYVELLEYFAKLRPPGPLVELGCGNAAFLQEVARRELYASAEIYGIEQSKRAIQGLAEHLPNVVAGDIEEPLPFTSGFAGCVVMAEVIEHLVNPLVVLAEVRRVLRPGGILALSFPNYLNLPWLAIRVLADVLDKPSWIVLQPIDRMYTYPVITRKLRSLSFGVSAVRGSVFLPPLLYRWEPRWFRSACNGLRLGCFAFHPVIIAKAV